MNKKKRKTKYNYGRLLDLIEIIIFPLVSFLFIFTIKKFTNKYTIMAAIALCIIYAIAILTIFLKNKKVHLTRRIILLILVVLITFGYNYSSSIAKSFTNITGNSNHDKTVIKMDLLVKKDSDYQTSKQLDNTIIGYQVANDEENSKYCLKKINKDNSNIRELTYSDYQTMYSDYYNGYVDAILVNQSEKNNLGEDYQSLYDDSKVLKTYKRTIKNSYNGNDLDITSKPFTVLISANDEVGSPASNSLSDMNMLMMINPNTNSIKTVSIPRDSYVENPAYDNEYDKLTHTGNNGIENTVKAVEQTFQVDIDFYVKISFDSLIKIVDTIGGINVDVGITFCEQDENRSFAAEDEICLTEGEQKLNGKQALAYARHRHSYENQDLGRNEAQLKVIKGIIKQLLTTEGISKVDDVLDILPDYVITNFSDSQLSSFVRKQVDELKGWTITSEMLEGGTPDMAVTASGGYDPLAIYYLSESEVKKVNGLFNLIKNEPSMAKFTYNKDNLYKDYINYKEDPSNQMVE